jgi:hypothetical protein
MAESLDAARPKIEKQTYESAAAEPQASDQEERQASD